MAHAKHASQFRLFRRNHQRDVDALFVPGLLDGEIGSRRRLGFPVKRVGDQSPFRDAPITIDLAFVEHIPRPHSGKPADQGRRQGKGRVIVIPGQSCGLIEIFQSFGKDMKNLSRLTWCLQIDRAPSPLDSILGGLDQDRLDLVVIVFQAGYDHDGGGKPAGDVAKGGQTRRNRVGASSTSNISSS